MIISTHILHRGIGAKVAPTSDPYASLGFAFTNSLWHDIEFDRKTRFSVSNDDLGHKKGINSLAIDRTGGRWLVSGGADGGFLLWDLEDEDENQHIAARIDRSKTGKKGNRYGISSIRFNPNNSSLFTATSYDKTLKIYTIDPSIREFSTYDIDANAYSHSISTISSRALIAVVGSSPHIRLIDPRASRATETLFGHTAANLSVAWSPRHAAILASGSLDGSIRIWDIRFGSYCLGSLDSSRPPAAANRTPGQAHDGGVNGLVWTGDGMNLVSSGMDNKIRVWEMEKGMNTNVIFPPVVKNKYQAEFGMVLVEDCVPNMLFVGTEDQLFGFDVNDGRLLKRLRVPKELSRDEIGRISGLVSRGLGYVELYTSHTMGRAGYDGDRENILRWRPKFLIDDDEEVFQEERTDQQRRLEEIFDSLTKEPVRFG